MFIDNEPKFTLGLKKKPAEYQPQANINKRPKLSLGLRKSADNSHSMVQEGTTLNLKQFKPQIENSRRIQAPQTSIVKMPKTQGKLEINIKISELPNWIKALKNGWQQFCINVDGQIIQIMVRPKVWNKLLKANEEYPLWIASITGKMGPYIKNGFELLEPAIQVYEKQPKIEK
jgi:hypothetical protein